jgi:hypothetical protein
MIKTFRGMLPDQGQSRIRLSTKKGKTGYKIIKFEIMPNAMGTVIQQSMVKLYKITQTSVDGLVDFTDGNLLAAAFIGNDTSTHAYPPSPSIIFDQEIFNQDIYVTHFDTKTGEACNYYLELETINMTDNAAAVSTLRDIRLNPQVGG